MTLVCTCEAEGPDECGNYDLIENPDCPIHGEVGEDDDSEWRSVGRLR